jgi:hypothetical protein
MARGALSTKRGWVSSARTSCCSCGESLRAILRGVLTCTSTVNAVSGQRGAGTNALAWTPSCRASGASWRVGFETATHGLLGVNGRRDGHPGRWPGRQCRSGRCHLLRGRWDRRKRWVLWPLRPRGGARSGVLLGRGVGDDIDSQESVVGGTTHPKDLTRSIRW